MEKSFSVGKYLQAIKNKIDGTPAVWVHGVITQIQNRDKVVYLSIAEFIEGDVKPKATLSLFIFRHEYDKLTLKLASLEKPFVLKQELKVCFLIQADFYIPYGKFQCKILDIDPKYTIGELALTKEAILSRLKKENLLMKNASLPFPDLPLKVGLITGEGTAAYHDFTTKLKDSGFCFQVIPAYAKMQGNETENTILIALANLRETEGIDVVCIIRGGGSKTDLNYFDSEVLCRAIANYPIPVLTGIGHEIDNSLLDLVAFQHCITPTDTAKYLIDIVSSAWQKTKDLALEIASRVQSKLPYEQERNLRIREAFERSVSKIVLREREFQNSFFRELKKIPGRLLNQEKQILERYTEGLKNGTRKILELAKKNTEVVSLRIQGNDPKTILAKGYSITLDEKGHPIKNISGLEKGKAIKTQLAAGVIHSIVESLETE